jgi:protease PrsW
MLLTFAGVIFSLTFSSIRPDTAHVFLRSIFATSVLSLVPLAILWWLDRRERDSPWLFASASLWDGVIGTSLTLPVNSAILAGIAQWVAKNPAIELTLGLMLPA